MRHLPLPAADHAGIHERAEDQMSQAFSGGRGADEVHGLPVLEPLGRLGTVREQRWPGEGRVGEDVRAVAERVADAVDIVDVALHDGDVRIAGAQCLRGRGVGR